MEKETAQEFCNCLTRKAIPMGKYFKCAYCGKKIKDENIAIHFPSNEDCINTATKQVENIGYEIKEITPLKQNAVINSVSFLFPQIVIKRREIELTENEIEDLKNMCLDEKTDWIWSKMTEQEQNWTQGKEWVKSAIDAGYCGFRLYSPMFQNQISLLHGCEFHRSYFLSKTRPQIQVVAIVL